MQEGILLRINAGRVRRLWLVLLSLPLLMLMLAVPATPARAATAVNPFADLAGFTIYSSGDATLNNNELEGSVVAAHELSTSKQNYAVVHKVAGTGDYTIPVIDGVPVRMLANNYTIGASASAEPSFAVTNAGATTGTNEAQGSIKSVETSGWTAAERGGFVRVTPNAATPNFVIDLQSRAWSGTTSATEITRIKTQESSVAAYVSPDLTASTQCLASVVGNYVTVPAGDMAVLPALSTDRPNVFSYAELAGRTIKLNNNPGYQPTATAPIIVRVANGTTTIGKLNFEGWSSAAGAQQNYSSFILLDLSEVTNDVLIDGLEMGAIYAPQAEVTFNSNVTWNGQLIAGGFGAWGAGELHHHTFQPTLPCGSEPTTGRFAITKTVTGLNQGVDPGNFQFNYRIDQGPNQTATITP
ncbi:MAG: collagen-binding domain-containing protein, partial [Candidatus Phosphoribacter baldrii]